MQLLFDTWRALLGPRRLVPVLMVCIPMVLAQYAFTRDRVATLLAVAMCLAFLAIAPWAWRALFPRDEARSNPSRAWRLVLYSALAVAPGVTGYVVPRTLGLGSTFLTGRATILVVVALFWAGGWGLGRDIDLERGLDLQERRLARLAREAEQARLLALRAQLDPHFLFNTLNAIAEWVREDPLVAERAILQLSGVLRTVLDGVGPASWPLVRELELLDDLFALHLVRDPEAFTVERDVQGDLRQVRLPPLLLLPLAENAMTHGPRAGHHGAVRLEVRVGEGGVTVVLDNPGPFHGRRAGGEGLAMVEKRLALAYQGAASMHITGEGGRTRCTVSLPLGGPADSA